jgi:hypothetical protein
VKDENGHLLSYSDNNGNGLESFFSQLLNVHNVSDIRQIEIYTAEQPVPGTNHLHIDISIAQLKSRNFQAMIKFRQN